MRLGWLLLLASALSIGTTACAFSPAGGDGESGSEEESSPRLHQKDELEIGAAPGENSTTPTSVREAVGPQETRAEPEPQPWRPTRAQSPDNGSTSSK
jgi:hypothetical protein